MELVHKICIFLSYLASREKPFELMQAIGKE